MTKTFNIELLEATIEPYDLVDILDSLYDNGMVTSYDIDYRNGTVTVSVPLDVEISDLFSDESAIRPSGKKIVKGDNNG